MKELAADPLAPMVMSYWQTAGTIAFADVPYWILIAALLCVPGYIIAWYEVIKKLKILFNKEREND